MLRADILAEREGINHNSEATKGHKLSFYNEIHSMPKFRD